MSEKPTVTLVLLLVGGTLIVLAGVIELLVSIELGILGSRVGVTRQLATLTFGVLPVLFGALVIVGAVVANSSELSRVRAGATLGLVFGTLSLLVMRGTGIYPRLLLAGLLLSVVGGIVGLVWKPSLHQ
ncbi:MAG: hypothetical protein QXZ22_04120 [Sulfolobales archaeon]